MTIQRISIAVFLLSALAIAPAQAQWSGCGSGQCITSGNVGIGTTNPGYPFTVNGSQSDAFAVTGPSGSYVRTWLNGTTGSNLELNSNGNTVELQSDGSGNFNMNIFGGANAVFSVLRSGAQQSTLVLNSGNVGIGTTSPQHKLRQRVPYFRPSCTLDCRVIRIVAVPRSSSSVTTQARAP